MSWRDDAACRGLDPRLFLPSRGQDERPAKAVCAACTVREPCLEFALTSRWNLGIWGGTSERQRREIRRMRGLRTVA